MLPLTLITSCQKADPNQPKATDSPSSNVYYDNVIIQKDVVYGYDDSTQQIMDIYLQGQFTGEPNWVEVDKSPKNTLVFIHGGGWLGGDKADNPFVLADYLEKGWVVFSLNYRMGPGTAPNAAEDVICAMRWIADRKDDYGVDVNNIFTTGSSAGGHLSLVAGLAPTSQKDYVCDISDIPVKGIINYYGITEISQNEAFLNKEKPQWNYTITWIGERDRIDGVSKKYSPVYMASRNAPPVITIHGAVDSVVPYTQATLLEARLEELGILHKLVTIEDGNHGGFRDQGYERVNKEVFDFIESLD